jgi:hypothetical protein
MSLGTKQNEIKLDILQSLAMSQKALARMIENIADVTDHSVGISKYLMENIEIISKYQRALTVKLTGMTFPERKKGKPAKPWIYQQINMKKNMK